MAPGENVNTSVPASAPMMLGYAITFPAWHGDSKTFCASGLPHALPMFIALCCMWSEYFEAAQGMFQSRCLCPASALTGFRASAGLCSC